MPREIKTPLQYVMEDIPSIRRQSGDSQAVKIPKRGRPRTVGVISDVKSPVVSNKPAPRKSSESIVIPDEDSNDSDVEIIETPKTGKRKKDDDPDWGSERKIKVSFQILFHLFSSLFLFIFSPVLLVRL